MQTSQDFFSNSNINQILFEEAPIGLGISEMSGKLIKYNKMLLQVSGFNSQEIEQIGNVAKLYYNPEDREKILGLAMKQGFVNQFPVKFKKKDGSFFDSLMSLRKVQINNQIYWLAIVQDITKQIQAEEKLENKIKELESLNQIMIDRELAMVELKKRVQELEEKLSQQLSSGSV